MRPFICRPASTRNVSSRLSPFSPPRACLPTATVARSRQGLYAGPTIKFRDLAKNSAIFWLFVVRWLNLVRETKSANYCVITAELTWSFIQQTKISLMLYAYVLLWTPFSLYLVLMYFLKFIPLLFRWRSAPISLRKWFFSTAKFEPWRNFLLWVNSSPVPACLPGGGGMEALRRGRKPPRMRTRNTREF